jgi:hypothetical protein
MKRKPLTSKEHDRMLTLRNKGVASRERGDSEHDELEYLELRHKLYGDRARQNCNG